MSLEIVKSYLTKQLEFARDSYLQDLEALTEKDLLEGTGGEERKGIDFTYEVGYVNRRFATRLRGETPEPWPEGGWITAPEVYRNREAVMDLVRDSMNELIDAWKNVPAEEMTRVITLPSSETSPLDLVFSCVWHTGYHDAQLNYIQELRGDMTMHWHD